MRSAHLTRPLVLSGIDLLVLLSLVTACAPSAGGATRVGVDSFYRASVNARPGHFDSTRGAWTHTTPAYTLRYRLGTQPEGRAPASLKLELRNTGQEEVRLLWEASTFTYPTGVSSPMLRLGGGADAGEVSSTVVPPGAWLSVRAVPTASVTPDGVRPLPTLSRLGEVSFELRLALEVGGEPQTVALLFEGTDLSQSARVRDE